MAIIKSMKKKIILILILGFISGIIFYSSTAVGEFKPVSMNKPLSLVVEKARWCNKNDSSYFNNLLYRDVINDWVSSIETDSSGFNVGFHKPGNHQQTEIFGFNIGPFRGIAFDEYFVHVNLENGRLSCK